MDLSEKLVEFVNGWFQATREPFTGHPLASLFRQNLKEEVEKIVKQSYESFEVKASVGAGNWANVPWISILNPAITSTTQNGIYPVYLFNADGSGFYLSLNQGTTNPTKNLGKKVAEKRAEAIKHCLLALFPELNNWGIQEIDLKAETTLGKSYEKPNITAKFYTCSDIPESGVLINDLKELLKIYEKIADVNIESLLNANKTTSQESVIERILLPKPFLLLAGISGTGKSRFVRKQAEASTPSGRNYCHVAVRPDWHEPSDLLGYISRVGVEGPCYIATDVLKFIARSLTAVTECVDAKTGDITPDISTPPYWLCLDEMNLAPVEQYFADFLSILETREWKDGKYCCEPLLKPDVITTLTPKAQRELRENLGMTDSEHDDLWASFLQHGVKIPPNLIVAGTVNMDETTHGFSRKVIDRAMTLDFGEFFPNDFDLFFDGQPTPKILSYPVLTQATPSELATIAADNDGAKSIDFLKQVNKILKGSPFELAYRALNELLLSVVCFNPQSEAELKGVWDDFLMTKVLPRIEGDDDKLQNDGDDNNLLNRLGTLLESDCFAGIQQRPDFFRNAVSGDEPLMTELRSLKTIRRMDQRLRLQGFTAFWP